MPRRGRRTAAALLCGAAVALGGLTPAPAPAAPAQTCAQVAAVGTRPLAGSTPVVFVHGINSNAGMWTTGRNSIADQVGALTGVSAWTFDYSQASLEWVTDKRIGPRLASAIGCLADASGHPVIVVAHSMGGLATQYALSQPDTYDPGADVSAHVAEVITIGTPFTGSLLLTIAELGVDAAGATSPEADLAISAVLAACAGWAAPDNADNPCGLLSVADSPVGSALLYHSADIAALPPWPDGVPVLATAGDIEEHVDIGPFHAALSLGDVPVSLDSATAQDSAGNPVTATCPNVSVMDLIERTSPCYHQALPGNPTIVAAVIAAIEGITSDPCPAGSPPVAPPAGWQALPDTNLTQGGDPGGVCVQSDALYWGGIQMPGRGGDYTVTVRGRLEPGSEGWGVAARANGDPNNLTGHAIQYDPGAGGYRDVDYPGDTGPTYPATTDSAWHTLRIAVRGAAYTLYVDGAWIANGTLADDEASGSPFLRVWNGSAVEIGTPVVTPG